MGTAASAFTRREAALALTGWAATGRTQAETGVGEREIVVGQSIALQGGRNAYGMAVAAGVRLHLDAVNAAGGVASRRLVLRVLDDENDGARAAANARRLVDGGAFMLFGSIEGGPSTAVAEVAAAARVPFFAPMAGSPGLRRPFMEMVFPVRAEHRDEFRALMTYGRSLGQKTVGFVHSDTDVGRAHLANVRLLAQELGLEVALALPLKGGLDDAAIEGLGRQLLKAGPDLVFNHGSGGVYSKLVMQVRRASVRTTMSAVNSGSTEIAKALGPLAHGMVFSQVVPSPWERKHALTRDYQEAALRADANAAFGYGHLEGFASAKALVLALQRTGRQLTRAGFVAAQHGASYDLGGLRLRYGTDEHEGSRFVDLAMFSREGRFIH